MKSNGKNNTEKHAKWNMRYMIGARALFMSFSSLLLRPDFEAGKYTPYTSVGEKKIVLTLKTTQINMPRIRNRWSYSKNKELFEYSLQRQAVKLTWNSKLRIDSKVIAKKLEFAGPLT